MLILTTIVVQRVILVCQSVTENSYRLVLMQKCSYFLKLNISIFLLNFMHAFSNIFIISTFLEIIITDYCFYYYLLVIVKYWLIQQRKRFYPHSPSIYKCTLHVSLHTTVSLTSHVEILIFHAKYLGTVISTKNWINFKRRHNLNKYQEV